MRICSFNNYFDYNKYLQKLYFVYNLYVNEPLHCWSMIGITCFYTDTPFTRWMYTTACTHGLVMLRWYFLADRIDTKVFPFISISKSFKLSRKRFFPNLVKDHTFFMAIKCNMKQITFNHNRVYLHNGYFFIDIRRAMYNVGWKNLIGKASLLMPITYLDFASAQ